MNIHRYGWLAFCFYVILIPFLSILNLHQFQLRIFNLLGLGALITYFIAAILLIPAVPIYQSRQHIAIILSLFILFAAIKLYLSGTFFHFAKQIQPFIISIIFYSLGYHYISQHDKRITFLRIIIGSTLLLSFIGIIHYEYYPHVNIASITDGARLHDGILDFIKMRYRESATIPSPVGYSHILTFGIIAIFFYLRSPFKWLLTGVLLYALVISGSRSGLYYSVVFLLLAQYYYRTNRTSTLLLNSFSLIILLFGTVYFASNYSTFDLTSLYKSGLYLRGLGMKAGLWLLIQDTKSFLIGVPLDVRPAAFIYPYGMIAIQDNAYMTLLCEWGSIGLMIVSLLAAKFIGQLNKLRNIELNEGTRNYINVVTHCALAFIIFGMTNTIYKNLHQVVFLSLFIGSIFTIGTSSQQQRSRIPAT